MYIHLFRSNQTIYIEQYRIQAIFISWKMIQFCLLFFVSVLFLVFPFFVVVYRGNKERDRNTSVYSILHHFYKAICLFYISIGVSLVIILVSVIFGSDADIHFRIITPLTQCLIFFPMVIFNHAHHFVIFLLALQRLYFFFSQQIDNIKNSTATKSFLKWIYIILFFLHIVFFFWIALCENQRKIQYLTYGLYYAFLNSLTLLSALLYIPIMIRIRKFAHLPSYNLSNPQKYILYQTVVIALSKMAHLWVGLLVFFGSQSVIKFFIICVVFDVLSTPILIQVSYLFCNKRNVEALSREWSQHLTTVVKNAFMCRTVKVRPVIKEETTTA